MSGLDDFASTDLMLTPGQVRKTCTQVTTVLRTLERSSPGRSRLAGTMRGVRQAVTECGPEPGFDRRSQQVEVGEDAGQLFERGHQAQLIPKRGTSGGVQVSQRRYVIDADGPRLIAVHTKQFVQIHVLIIGRVIDMEVRFVKSRGGGVSANWGLPGGVLGFGGVGEW